MALPRLEFNARYLSGLWENWRITPRPAIDAEAVISDIPLLIFSGYFDPITPPSYREKPSANLTKRQYFLCSGISHGVLSSDKGEVGELSCAAQMVIDILEEPFN